MNKRLACVAMAFAATAVAGGAAAQTLPGRDDTAWEPIGRADDGAMYYMHGARIEAMDGLVSLFVRATVAPAPDGSPNTVIARVVIDCPASTIGVGTAEFYNETAGFLRTAEGPADPARRPAADPGQLLVMRRVCPAA